MSELKWKRDEVDPEQVRLALQKVQLSESRSTDDGSKIVPPILIAAARYAIESLTTTNQSLIAEVEKLRGQVPKWISERDYDVKIHYYIHNYGNESGGKNMMLVLDKSVSPPQPLHAEEGKEL
jgi:hypothetical protein